MAEISEISFTVSEHQDGKRLGDILREKGFSRKLTSRLKRTYRGILINSEPARTVDTVVVGDKVTITEETGGTAAANPQLKVDILFEDEHIVVFNKPPLMPCHESIKHRGDTLSNFFAYHCPDMTFRCINRLDRDTSGCVAVAKSRYCASALHKSCEKVYFGIVSDLDRGGGRICAPIAREKDSIIKRCVRDDGQYAATVFCRVKSAGRYSLCRFILETGRTHQIRCHMAHIGHPLVGDDMYGPASELISRQALHCGEISFVHPVTNEKITVKAPLPDDMKIIIED